MVITAERWLAVFRGGQLDRHQHEVDRPDDVCSWYWQRDAVRDAEDVALCRGYLAERVDPESRVVEYRAS